MKNIKLLFGILTIAVCLPFGQEIEAASFVPTGTMTSARNNNPATLLPNGKVLVTGGNRGNSSGNIIVSSAEIYDPATGNWTGAGTMSAVRWSHTATRLQNGKVLVAGGDNSSADLYDPATGNWTSTSSMTTQRRSHTATLLPNGKVLVTGGWFGTFRSSAEIYDPATGNWTSTGSMATARTGHTMTLLPNGKVLVTGGSDGSALSSAEMYDPETGNWTSAATMSALRALHTATLLFNGKVLVAGGTANVTTGNPGLSSAEMYDPATGNWTSTGAMSAERSQHTATRLPNGKVLVTGGWNGNYLTSAEIYDSTTGNWTSSGTMSAARILHTATLIPNGKVLVAGGYNGSITESSAELYVPDARLNDGLVAYYPFNGNANDASGNGNNGQPSDVTFGADRFGLGNNCALFNGTSSSIDVPNLNTFQYSPITYSVWFRLDAYPPPTSSGLNGASIMNLIGRERSHDTTQGAITLFSETGSMTNDMIYLTGASGSKSHVQPRTNTWYQLGLTIDANQTLSWYLNGVLLSSTNFTPAQTSQFAFRIGASAAPLLAWAPRYNWNGAIDDIRIYNRALSAEEVAELHAYESAPATHPPITNAISNWRSTGVIVSDVREDVTISGNGSRVVSVGGAANFFVSTNFGASWIDTGFQAYGRKVGVSYDGMRMLVPSHYGRLNISTDGGATWVLRGTSGPWNSGGVSSDGTTMAAGNYYGGQMWVSRDSGLTWLARGPGGYWIDVALSRDGKYMVAGMQTGQLMRSTDYGTNWTTVGPIGRCAAVTMSDDGHRVFAGLAGGNIYRSADYGLSWTPIPVVGSWTDAACSTNANVILFSSGTSVTNGFLCRSMDGGSTWTVEEPGQSWETITVTADGRKALAGVYTGFIYTNNFYPPAITQQPQSTTNSLGGTVSLSISATGVDPLNFQWYFSGTNIDSGTNSSLVISNIQQPFFGDYYVVVTNAFGSVTSSNAVLTAIPPTRTGTGTATLFDAFVVAVNITDGGSGYTNTPLVRLVGGGGSGAQALAVVSNGVITVITMRNAGYGYTSAPLVVIDPPFIPNPVLDIVPMSFLTFSNLTVSGSYQLQQSAGWYWTNEPLNFTATDSVYTQMVAGIVDSGDYRLALNPVPAQAFATAQVVNGFVVGANVTAGGLGYVTSPAVSITGGGGTNATMVSHLSGGVVVSLSVASAGIGYTNTPTIQIAQPPAAAVSPTVQPVMRLDSSSLAPYDNYQIQFTPTIGGTWGDWNGGLFSPTADSNSQYLFITNGTEFFRLQFVP